MIKGISQTFRHLHQIGIKKVINHCRYGARLSQSSQFSFGVFEREKFVKEMDKEIEELRKDLDSNYKDSKEIFQQEAWGVSFN